MLQNGTSGYELPRWQTVENDWNNFTRLDQSDIWEKPSYFFDGL